MSTDPYARQRAAAAELLRFCVDVGDATRQLREHVGGIDAARVEVAVAVRLVALLTRGVEEPTCGSFPYVLAPNGRRIQVRPLILEHGGLFSGWTATKTVEQWDEFAVVAFEQLVPRVVHIIDRERCPLISEMIGVGMVGSRMGRDSDDVILSAMFHYNVMLEPLIAEAAGVRTFVVDESANIGWTRLEGVVT